jgi:hypothetical protein
VGRHPKPLRTCSYHHLRGVHAGRVRVCFEEAKDPKSGELLRIPQWEVVS